MSHHLKIQLLGAILRWKLPTARFNCRGYGNETEIINWEEKNVDPQPTPEQIVQWKQEYDEQRIEAKQIATQFATSPDMTALVNMLADKLDISAETLTQDLITARENEEP